MNYGRIYVADVANGPGCRVSLFVSGCTHHCKGCFNKPTWDFNFGELYTGEVEDYILSCLATEGNDGLTILGGEPMEPANQPAIAGLIRRIRATKNLKEKSIWVYSGYTFDELKDPGARCHTDYTQEILSSIDVLVDGEFVEEEKDITLAYRGSRNQRIIFLWGGEPICVYSGRQKADEWEGKESGRNSK